MSERLPHHNPEHHHHSPEHKTTPEKHVQHPEQAKHVEHKHHSDVETIRRQVEQEAVSGRETQARHAESDQSHQPSQILVNKELRSISYQRTMLRVRKQLPAGQKALSKIIHQPVIDTVSNAGAKTVARPSGLFGGGLCTLIGGTIYYFVTKHYGYEYNPTVYLALLAIGFVAGVLLEVVWKSLGTKAKG